MSNSIKGTYHIKFLRRVGDLIEVQTYLSFRTSWRTHVEVPQERLWLVEGDTLEIRGVDISFG